MKARNRYTLMTVVTWGICLLLFGAFYVLVAQQQRARRQELDAKIDQSMNLYNIAVEASKKENIIRLKEEIEQLKHTISDFVVTLEDAPDLIFQINQLANKGNLNSFGMKSKNRRGSGSPPELEYMIEKRIEVDFLSSFHEFAAFLNALERYHPVVFVEAFAIRRPQQRLSEPRVNMDLAVFVERLGQPELTVE